MNAKLSEQFINGRVVGGYSVHAEHKPELCDLIKCYWRVVACCEQDSFVQEGRDIKECSGCGKQVTVSCDFDEEYS